MSQKLVTQGTIYLTTSGRPINVWELKEYVTFLLSHLAVAGKALRQKND